MTTLSKSGDATPAVLYVIAFNRFEFVSSRAKHITSSWLFCEEVEI